MGPGEMGLGKPCCAVIGTHVPVDVKPAARVLRVGEVGLGEDLQKAGACSQLGQFLHAPAHRLYLGGPVENDEPSDVSRVDPGKPLGPTGAQKRRENHGEHERADRVERRTPGRVDRVERVEQPGDGESGQHE